MCYPVDGFHRSYQQDVMTEPTRPSTKGTGCAVLFLLPFAAFGVAMAVITAWCVVDWVRMQSWVETPVTLHSLKLVDDESDRIDAEYEYAFGGQKYKGSRVALHSGSDNIGTFHKRKFQQLELAKNQGKPVTAYVNANDPADAVLFRDLRPEMIVFKGVFALVFGLIGVGGMMGMWFVNRDTKRQIALADAHPNEPWRWQKDWSEGLITSSSYGAAIAVGVVAGIWNLGVCFAAAALFMDGDRPSLLLLLVFSLFVLVGLGLLAWAIVLFARWRYFPRATFRMASTPGVVGGSLAGVVLLPGKVRPEGGFRTTLTCTREDKSDSESGPTTLWEDERIVVRTLEEENQDQTAVPVAFVIPSDASPSDPHAKIAIGWKLSLRAELPGPDISFEFKVPVFYTTDSRDDIPPAGEPLTEFEQSESLAELLARESITVGEGISVDSVIYSIPPARHRALATWLTIFSNIWFAIVIGLFWFEQWIIASIFAAFGALIVFATVHTWLAWSELRITGDDWHYRWGWWPWTFATRHFASDEIEGFIVKYNARAGYKSYGDIVCNLREGKPITLARMLVSRRAERVWMDELTRRAGLTVTDGV
jgi:hypothetical protein